MKKIILFNFVIFVGINILGCHPNVQLMGEYDKDVTNNKKYWGGYVPNQEYKLNVDLFLNDVSRDDQKFVAIVPPDSYRQCGGFYSSPNTVAEYLDNPNRWPSTIGVIEEGTIINCTMIRKTGTWLWPESVHVWGEILNGPYEGVIVTLVDISSYMENGRYSPDERFLKHNRETVK